MSRQPTMFTSGVELANLVLNSNLLHHSWAAIEKLYRETTQNDPALPFSIKHKVYERTPLGTVIAFVSSPPCTTLHLQGEGSRDLVSSESLVGENFPLFQFVSTKLNPKFSLHRAAVTLFASLKDELSSLKDQHGQSRPLIVTGHSIGGSIASLFTLWLLESIPPKDTRRPFCITFGSPLIGDNVLQQAISECPIWNSCFLHVASNHDPIPKLFLESAYKPFGTFILCSELGFSCFEEPDSSLDLMVAINSASGGNRGVNEGTQIVNYGDVLEKLKRGVICRGVSELGRKDFSPLGTGIFIQIEAVHVQRTQLRQENGDINSLMSIIEKRAARKRNVFDPSKKLNRMKINMTHIEWYKKDSASRGGYYDAFKNVPSTSREDIVKQKSILTQYWDEVVKEAEKMPQKEGAYFLLRWLYAGTNYRRLVEPLDIAEWYRKGKKDYLAQRPEHYKQLEKWMKDDKRESNGGQRDRSCSLTEDSCFWAHVEDATILCESLKDGKDESSREKLVKFEVYVMDLITKRAVSPEIFLEQSSFMKWWGNYEKVKGSSYPSSLTDFMGNYQFKQYV